MATADRARAAVNAEDLTVHGAHRADVGFPGDPPQCYTCWQWDVHIQRPRFADHDRLWFLGDEPVGNQGVVQAGRMVMPAGLPLDPLDVGICLVVGKRL